MPRSSYFKGAESDAGQIDGHQNADEPVTKRAHASRREQEANIPPFTVGATHRRRGRRDLSQKLDDTLGALKPMSPEIGLWGFV
jgi:hypothetical protein